MTATPRKTTATKAAPARKAPADRRAPRKASAALAAAPDPAPGVRVRLVKVSVQAVLVLDDGTNLQEVTTEPQVVPAVDWSAFAQSAFGPEHLAAYGQQLLFQAQQQAAAQQAQAAPAP